MKSWKRCWIGPGRNEQSAGAGSIATTRRPERWLASVVGARTPAQGQQAALSSRTRDRHLPVLLVRRVHVAHIHASRPQKSQIGISGGRRVPHIWGARKSKAGVPVVAGVATDLPPKSREHHSWLSKSSCSGAPRSRTLAGAARHRGLSGTPDAFPVDDGCGPLPGAV